ncbi:hypothetical protein EI555_006536, partial [Monodon monoceros]
VCTGSVTHTCPIFRKDTGLDREGIGTPGSLGASAERRLGSWLSLFLGMLSLPQGGQGVSGSREVQTSGAGFTGYWPELLEHVFEDKAAFGSLEGIHKLLQRKGPWLTSSPTSSEVHFNARENIMKVLNMVHLDCIQEVQKSFISYLELTCHLSFQELIARFLSRLTESDLTHLSLCPNISQLKGLDLSGVTLTNFSPELLQVLLEKVATVLQDWT